MENAFKIRKGLIVTASGSTAVDIQGNSGQLFSITDSLTGVLMSVNDISGLPILEVSSDDTVKMGTFGAEGLIVSGSSLVFPNVPNAVGDLATITANGTISRRTVSQLLSDIGAQPALTNPVTGTGTTNYLPKFTGASTLGNSLLFDNGTNVGIGTTSPTSKLQITATAGLSHARWTESSTTVGFIGGSNGLITGVNGSFAVRGESGLVFSGAGNSTAMYLSTSGNLGIGNTSPASKLEVSGNVAIGYTNAAPADGMIVAGDVGIGTTSPSQKLHVAGSAQVSGQFAQGVNVADKIANYGAEFRSSGASAQIFFGRSGTSVGSGAIGADESYVFSVWNTPSFSRPFVITQGGNVGIGTTEPSEKLTVAGKILSKYGSSTNHSVIEHRDTSDNVIFSFRRSDGAGGNGNDLVIRAYEDIHLAPNNSDDSKLVVKASGNVGIGTNSPTGKLEVAGNIYASLGDTYDLGTNSSGNRFNWGYFGSGVSSGTSAQGLTLKTAADWPIIFTTNNVEKTRILSNGNVGIGNTSPASKLEVSGNVAIGYTNAAPANGMIVAGDVGIGTNNPDYPLTIQTQNATGFKLLHTGGIKTTFQVDSFGTTGTDAGALVRLFNESGDNTVNIDGRSGGFRNTYFNQGGNVGIGTTSPAFKLETIGSARISGNLSIGTTYNGFAANIGGTVYVIGASVWVNDGFGYANASSNTGMFPDSSHNITFKSNNSTKVYINADGNVGIGTTAPSVKMHSEGKTLSRTPNSGWGQSAVANPNDAEVGFVWAAGGSGYPGVTSTYTRQWIAGLSPFGTGTDRWSLTNKTLGANTAITVLEAGNVGIGTTSPASNLHVNSSVATALRIGTTSTTEEPKIIFIDGSGDYATIEKVNRDIKIRAFNTDVAYFTSTGNVGIGTTVPSTKLEVGNFLDAVTNKITVAARYEYEPEFNFRLGQSGTNLDWIGAVISSGDDGNYNGKILFKTANAGRDTPTTKMVIKANGNVGIGTTSPTFKLDVSGTGRFTSTVTAPTFSGALSGNATTATTLQTARTINGTSFNGSANITTANWGTARDINGTSVNGSGNVAIGRIYDTNFRRITNPGGGEFVTQTPTVTGAIEIVYPVGFTNTMHRIVIKVYEYTTNESFEIHVGGYNYGPSLGWINPFAYIIGNPNVDRRFNVRFGRNAAGRAVIYVGETGSTWSYPQVFVTEVVAGFSGHSVTWTTGWAINFKTAFENVTATISNCQVGYAVSTNTANSNVLRDGSGNFSAGTITATLSGNANTATTLQNARLIGGVSFNGSANINLPGVNTTGNQNTSGNAATATTTVFVSSPDGDRAVGNKLPTDNPRAVRFDFATASSVGSAGKYAGVMTYAPWDGTSASTGDSSYQLAFTNQSGVNASGPAQLLLRNGINSTWNSFQTILSSTNFNSYSPTLTGGGASGTWSINVTGNSGTATTLQTARTLTIGSTGKTFNGSANVAWSLAEIGAYAATNPSQFLSQPGVRASLSFTAGSGAYNNTTGVITIPTNTNQLTNGAGFTTYTANQAVDTTSTPTFAGLNLGNGDLNTVENIYLDNQIISQGDTNTYMQFHAADQWRVVTGGTERLEVNNTSTIIQNTLIANGNVGIGTTGPGYPLEVSGNTGGISIYTSDDIVAFSDISVKGNIKPIEGVLERVSKSRGVVYDRIDTGTKDNIGFIAQELEEQFPELVVTNPNGTKAVKYQNATAVLFEAVKELKQKIESQEERLNKLEQLIAGK